MNGNVRGRCGPLEKRSGPAMSKEICASSLRRKVAVGDKIHGNAEPINQLMKCRAYADPVLNLNAADGTDIQEHQ